MKQFQSLVRYFRRAFPSIRFRVRRVAVANHYAQTYPDGGGFLIKIDPDLCEGGAIAWLIHEMAHALSFHIDSHATMHGLQFGSAYALVYEKYEAWTNACVCSQDTTEESQ